MSTPNSRYEVIYTPDLLDKNRAPVTEELTFSRAEIRQGFLFLEGLNDATGELFIKAILPVAAVLSIIHLEV